MGLKDCDPFFMGHPVVSILHSHINPKKDRGGGESVHRDFEGLSWMRLGISNLNVNFHFFCQHTGDNF